MLYEHRTEILNKTTAQGRHKSKSVTLKTILISMIQNVRFLGLWHGYRKLLKGNSILFFFSSAVQEGLSYRVLNKSFFCLRYREDFDASQDIFLEKDPESFSWNYCQEPQRILLQSRDQDSNIKLTWVLSGKMCQTWTQRRPVGHYSITKIFIVHPIGGLNIPTLPGLAV